MSDLIGVDLGGTHLRVGLVRGRRVEWETRVAAHFHRRCRPDAPEEALAIVNETLAGALQGVLERAPDALAVGLAVPGFVDPQTARLLSSPNIPGVTDADLAGPLASRFGLPVVMENDANAAAWGVRESLPDRPNGLMFFGLGTGVGGGLILGGSPFRGRHGCAMEVGHIIIEPGGRPCGCGNRGCMERYASASGVSLSYGETTGDSLSAHEIAERARKGDSSARAALETAGGSLARVVAHLCKTLDIEEVAVGGGLTGSWDLMESAFHQRLEADLVPVLRGRCRVRVVGAGDQAGMVGAALLAERALE